METSFLDQFSDNDFMHRCLSPQNRLDFYDRMKSVVVSIRVFHPPQSQDGTRRVHRLRQKYELGGEKANVDPTQCTKGSGFLINQEGCIMTCSHVIPDKFYAVLFCFEHARSSADDYRQAILVRRNVKSDLALLKPTESFTVNYAMLSPGPVEVGMEVSAIFHPHSLDYTYLCGQVTYPDYRLAEEGIDDDDELFRKANELHVIPINNLHGGEGGSGGPVFDSCGRVVGIYSFSGRLLDYAVHVTVIKDFWELAQESLKKLIKRTREREDSSSSHSRQTKSSRKGSSSRERLEHDKNDKVVSSKFIQNKQSGQPECYGFVEFGSHAAMGRALQAYNGSLMPNIEQNYRLNMASFGVDENHSDGIPDFSIFAGYLTSDVTDFTLQETFRPHYPSAKGAKVVSDRLAGQTKGYGFVRFGDDSEQLHAMTEMNGKFCSTRPMRIGPTANKKIVGKRAVVDNEYDEDAGLPKLDGKLSKYKIDREKPPRPPSPLKKGHPDSKEKQGPDVPRAEEVDIFLGNGIHYAIPSKDMSQSPISEDMEESTQIKEIVSYFNEPAYGPVPPYEPSQDWQQMGAYDPMQGHALAGGYQGEWHNYQYADQLAYPEQYLQQNIEKYDVQTGLDIQQDPRLMTREEMDRGLGSVFKCDDQRLQELRERDSWEKDPSFISGSYSGFYPGYEEFNREIVDSDDEADFLTLDMGGRVPVAKTNLVNSSRKLLMGLHI